MSRGTARAWASDRTCALDRPEASSGRRSLYAAAAVLWMVFAAGNVSWIARDSQPPGCDQAYHLMRSLEFGHAFGSFDVAQMVRLWKAEYGSEGQFTYPPLYHLVTGAFTCLVQRPALAGVLANMAFLWLLIVGVMRLGTAAFDDRVLGVAAAALTAMYFCVAQLAHEAFIDFSLTAMTAWCSWRLAATDGFEHRRRSIVFGLAIGLGLLAKQTLFLFLVGPSVYVLLRMPWRRETWINVLLATVAVLLVALPWYGLHVQAILNTLRINQEWASVENDPMPWTPYGAVVYLHWMSAAQIGFPLFVLALVAAGVWSYRRATGRRPPGTSLARGIIVSWAVVGWALLTFVVLNKEPRYTMPILPAIALITCGIAADVRSPMLRGMWLVVVFVCALPYYLLFTFGISPTPRNIGFSVGSVRWEVWVNYHYYGTGPRQEDWSIPEMLDTMRREHGDRPMRLGLVPFSLRINQNSILLEAIERGAPVVVVPVGNADPVALLKFDFVLLTSGYAGPPYVAGRAADAAKFVAARPEAFRVVGRYSLPDQSVGTLYRVGYALRLPKT